MSEHDPNLEQERRPRQEASGQEERPAYTPASFEKRVAAWTGIAYMLMLMFVITYAIFTARDLPGTFPLLLVPVAAACQVIALRRCAQRRSALNILMAAVSAAAAALGLICGVPALIAALTAPMG